MVITSLFTRLQQIPSYAKIEDDSYDELEACLSFPRTVASGQVAIWSHFEDSFFDIILLFSQ